MKQPLLLVSAGGRQLAFRMADVIEVQEGGEVHRVPAGAPALRGVTTVRGRLVPQVHLGALLDQGTCPPEPCATVVVATTDTGLVAFEVDDADAHPAIEILPAPEDETLSWVSGVLRKEERWVPVLNLTVLEERLRTSEVSHA